jgi:hypothetical protein
MLLHYRQLYFIRMSDSNHSSETQHHSQEVLLHEKMNTHKNNGHVPKPAHHASEDLVRL